MGCRAWTPWWAWGWVVLPASLVAFLWLRWLACFSTSRCAAGVRAAGASLKEGPLPQSRPCLQQPAELQSPIPPALLAMARLGRCRWRFAPCRCACLPSTEFRSDVWCFDGLLVAVGCLDAHRRTPAAEGRSLGTDLAAGMANLQAPLVLEVRRVAPKRPGPRSSPSVERPSAQGADRPRRPECRRFQRWWCLLLAPGHVCVLVAVGHQVVPRCWPRAPRVHGGMAGMPCSGRWPVRLFQLALQMAIAGSCGLPLCLGPGSHPITVGTRAWLARSGCCSAWRCSIEIASACRPFLFDKTAPSPRPAGGDRVGAGVDLDPVCEPERKA